MIFRNGFNGLESFRCVPVFVSVSSTHVTIESPDPLARWFLPGQVDVIGPTFALEAAP